MSHQN